MENRGHGQLYEGLLPSRPPQPRGTARAVGLGKPWSFVSDGDAFAESAVPRAHAPPFQHKLKQFALCVGHLVDWDLDKVRFGQEICASSDHLMALFFISRRF